MSALDRARGDTAAVHAPTWFGTRGALFASRNALERDKVDEALRQAERAAGRSPMRPGVLSSLALARAAAGTGGSNAAFLGSARLGWRDPVTTLWALDAAMRAGQTGVAVQHYEALYRSAPDALIDQIAAATTGVEPALTAALADRLGRGGAWVDRLVRTSPGLPPTAFEGRLAMLEVAAKRGYLPSPSLLAEATSVLFEKRPDDSRALWTTLAGMGDLATDGLWDARFARSNLDAVQSPFAWRPVASGGVIASIERAHGGERLIVAGSSAAPVDLVETALILPPGRYAVAWTLSRPDPSLTVALSCRGSGDAERIASSPALVQSVAIYDIRAGCRIAMVTVRASPLAPGEQRADLLAVRVGRAA